MKKMKSFFFLVVFIHVFLSGMKHPDELLKKLKKDRFEKKSDYNRIYFAVIANALNTEIKLLEEYLTEPRLSLISEYKELLRFHAHRYIKQLIRNPVATQKEKIMLLEETFPQDNPILKNYYAEGLQDLNVYESQRLPKHTTQQTRHKALLEKQELKHEKEYEKLNIFLQSLAVQRQEHEKEEKIQLLKSIIESDPERAIYINPNLYTPEVFQQLFNAIDDTQKNKQDATDLLREVEYKAITYINFVATNDEWKTPEDKLKEIENHLAQFTLFYLQKTLKYDQPLQKIQIFEPKTSEKGGFVEEIFSEEESPKKETQAKQITIKEQPVQPYQTPQSIERKTFTSTQLLPSKKEKQEEIKPEKNPFSNFLSNMTYFVSQTATFIKESITGFLSYIYNSFLNIFPK